MLTVIFHLVLGGVLVDLGLEDVGLGHVQVACMTQRQIKRLVP
jgi:hypothetical protein